MDHSSPAAVRRDASASATISAGVSASVSASAPCGGQAVSEPACAPPADEPETSRCRGLQERRARLHLPLKECNDATPAYMRSIKEQDPDEDPAAQTAESSLLNGETKSQRPKGIVKSPSEKSYRNGGRKILFKSDSVRSKGRGIVKSDSVEGDRPVLHVQFNSGCLNGSVTTGAGPGGSCTSPACSLTDSGSSSSSEDACVGLTEARPPDGGWGWVVVFATFMVNLIADGITLSFGVMYVHFLEYFGEGKSKTAWIGSLFMAMPLLSGPIASFLTDRYGCRKMCICGSIIASIGFIASAFTTNMESLFFTFGIVSGFGLSLCYVAAVVIVAYYFEKKRSLATGLSVCGSGIGTFIFAPLTQVMLDEYGWRGTTLILAGLFLNISVCGALMRDLAWTAVMAKAKAQDRKRSREQKRLKRYGSSADSFSDSKSTNTVGTNGQPALLANTAAVGDNADNATRQCSSLVNLPTYVNNGENVPVEVLELLASRKNVYNVLMQNYPSMLISSRSFSDSGRVNELGCTGRYGASPLGLVPVQPELPNNSLTRSNPVPSRPPTAFLKDLRIHRHSLTYRGAMLNINRYRLRASSCPNIYRNSMTTIAKEKLQWYAGLWEFWDLVVDMMDFYHFGNSKFLLFAISNFLLYTWYDVPYMYITDNAVELGYTEKEASILISVVGIVNMVGEILLGWAGDWQWVDAGCVYACCMLLCGCVTAVVPLLTSYPALCAASGAFGLFIAANYSLTSIILVELITLENFTSAYGLLLLVQGVANLVGPPLAGWLYDVTGTYELSFYIAGFFIFFSGLLLLVLPINKRFRKYRSLRRKETASASTSSIEEHAGMVTANGICRNEKNNRIFV